MLNSHSTMVDATAALVEGDTPLGVALRHRPTAATLVEALKETEKQARKTKTTFTHDQLVGCWQLRFITGTKKSRQKAGTVLGPGRFIPSWLIKIYLDYGAIDPSTGLGQVHNSVCLGPFTMTLSGPTRWWSQTNSLAFDFTQITIKVFDQIIYQGEIRGGITQAEKFAKQTLKDQVFFGYFLIETNAIAARGRGGGLALWTRSPQERD